MADSEDQEPYFSPFEEIFLRRREEILQLVGLSVHAMQSMEGSARLGKVLKYDSGRVEEIRKVEEATRTEVKLGFPLLHSAATVLLWGALETSVRDFVVRWLQLKPEARGIPEIAKIRIQFGEYDSLDEEGRIRYLVGLLEKDTGASLKPGIGRFGAILKPLGICPKCKPDQRKILSEMAAIRNVIVHRAGNADARFVDLCPWLDHSVGDTVAVTPDTFSSYVSATSEYVISIVESARDVAGAA